MKLIDLEEFIGRYRRFLLRLFGDEKKVSGYIQKMFVDFINKSWHGTGFRTFFGFFKPFSHREYESRKEEFKEDEDLLQVSGYFFAFILLRMKLVIPKKRETIGDSSKVLYTVKLSQIGRKRYDYIVRMIDNHRCMVIDSLDHPSYLLHSKILLELIRHVPSDPSNYKPIFHNEIGEIIMICQTKSLFNLISVFNTLEFAHEFDFLFETDRRLSSRIIHCLAPHMSGGCLKSKRDYTIPARIIEENLHLKCDMNIMMRGDNRVGSWTMNPGNCLSLLIDGGLIIRSGSRIKLLIYFQTRDNDRKRIKNMEDVIRKKKKVENRKLLVLRTIIGRVFIPYLARDLIKHFKQFR